MDSNIDPSSEQRWIECEELYSPNRHDDGADENDSTHQDDYYNLFSEPDLYQMYYFTLYKMIHGEYQFERHLENDHPRKTDTQVETQKDMVLRGIKAEYGQVINSTGLTLWRAATLLCNFLCRHCQTCIVNKSILELGAGMGLCGIVCYNMGKCNRVVMTDGDTDVLNGMRYNVQINVQSEKEVNSATSETTDVNELLPCRQLIWGHDQQLQDFKRLWGTFDVIIGSDIIYQESIIDPLFETVQELLTPSSTNVDLHNQDTLEIILSKQSVFLLAYARRNVQIDLVLDSAVRHGLEYIVPGTDEGVYIFYPKFEA